MSRGHELRARIRYHIDECQALRKDKDDLNGRIGTLTQSIRTIESENAKLKSALRFYADPESWKDQTVWVGYEYSESDTIAGAALEDRGEKARRALNPLEAPRQAGPQWPG